MRDVAGISRAYQCALIETLDELLQVSGLDHEVARRAEYLKWGLVGYDPGQEPLPFLEGSPPLVPAAGSPAKARA
jgi:hypothetical protein